MKRIGFFGDDGADEREAARRDAMEAAGLDEPDGDVGDVGECPDQAKADKPEPADDRRGSGPEALFYAAIQIKVEDVHSLRREGIIVGDGSCVAQWPRLPSGQPKVYLGHYGCQRHVEDLLDYFACGEFAYEIAMLGSGIDVEKTLKALGIARRTIPLRPKSKVA